MVGGFVDPVWLGRAEGPAEVKKPAKMLRQEPDRVAAGFIVNTATSGLISNSEQQRF